MIELSEAQDRAAALVAAARAAGADAADVAYHAQASTDVAVRLGRLEDVSRSESEDIALRVFVGTRHASVSASSLDPAALQPLVDRAIAMAREAPEDAFAGLAPADRLMTGAPFALDLVDASDPMPETLRALALEAEDAARAVPGVTNSEGAGASMGEGQVALATSTGFVGGYRATQRMLSASVLAGEGGAMQRDHDWRSAHHLADLPPPAEIGRRAGERAVARLNPAVPRSGAMPVVFDPRVASSLLGHFVSAISGPAVARRTTFLLDRMGSQVFAPGIRIVDDPLRVRGLGSRAFDGEGLPASRTVLVEDGVPTGWLVDSTSGRQLGLAPTGHAARGGGVAASNLHLEAGTITPAALIADIAEGIYVTELIGMGVNGVTGDYSRGASGYLIRDGKIAGPVSEFTVAGNLLAMYAALTPANDLSFIRATNAPTSRIDGMTVAGA